MKEYKIKVNGNDYAVAVNNIENDTADVVVNGTKYHINVEGMKARPAARTKVTRPVATSSATPPATHIPSTPAPAAVAAGSAGGIKSPLPGVILDIMVREGDAVKSGQKLMLLEAMKMENDIVSDRDGVVSAIKVSKGSSVLEGDVLITIG